MGNAIEILFQSFIDSFKPRLLMLTLIAVTLATVLWLALIWLSIDPLIQGALALLGYLGFDIPSNAVGLDGVSGWLKVIVVPLAVLGFLWPMVATSAVVLAGLYVTPAVLSYLSETEYRHVARQGDSGMVRSVWVTLRYALIFLLLWIVTLPLWLIPGMALVLPIVLTAYLLIGVMRFDALSTHATLLEIKQIAKRDSSTAWMIGLVCAVLSFIPPILLIMPVMSAVAFCRLYLKALEAQRQNAARQGTVINSTLNLN